MSVQPLDARITALLGRYSGLQYDELRDLLFADGSYSQAAEREIEPALDRLRTSGAIKAAGRWGPFQLAPDGGPKPRRKAKPIGPGATTLHQSNLHRG